MDQKTDEKTVSNSLPTVPDVWEHNIHTKTDKGENLVKTKDKTSRQ